jgi:hypothetical protein
MLRRLINGEIALGFLLATLFWIAALGLATSYAPTNPEKEACYQASAKSGRSTEECKTFWEKTTSDPVATFTLVLAFSTVGLWVATIGLYFAGERQLRHAQAVAAANNLSVTNSIAEAARSATAMESVSATIQNNARRQLRAYVAVMPGDTIHQDDQTPIFFEFHPSVRNNGFTPAYDVVILARTVLADSPLPSTFNFALTVPANTSVATLGFQQAMFTVTFIDRMLTAAEVAEIKLPTGRRLYVYGDVSYRDIFGERWTTNFCYWIAWGTQGPAWFTTPRHNDAT